MIEIAYLAEVIQPKEFGIVNPGKARRLLDRLVLDVTYRCDLRCPNCNRLCGLFPRERDVSVATVRRLVDDSLLLEKRWEHIYIAGGEPSLHPALHEIFDELCRYVEYFRARFDPAGPMVKYFTNNHGPSARAVLERLPAFVTHVNRSNKTGHPPPFRPMTVAPIDLGAYDDANVTPCAEATRCGMTVNHLGLYPCAEAAAIDEILLGGVHAVECLGEVTFARMAAILHECCRYCGYYFEPYGYQWRSELMLSETWKRRIGEAGEESDADD